MTAEDFLKQNHNWRFYPERAVALTMKEVAEMLEEFASQHLPKDEKFWISDDNEALWYDLYNRIDELAADIDSYDFGLPMFSDKEKIINKLRKEFILLPLPKAPTTKEEEK